MVWYVIGILSALVIEEMAIQIIRDNNGKDREIDNLNVVRMRRDITTLVYYVNRLDTDGNIYIYAVLLSSFSSKHINYNSYSLLHC